MAVRSVDVAVIGAGQAGLAVSYYLHRAGCSHVVFERARVGESWRSQRWDSFVMNTPNALTLLPGQSVGGDDPEGFWTRDEFVARLEAYVTAYAVPVRERTEVVALEQRAHGPFVLRIAADGSDAMTTAAAAVVVASGIQQQARIPALGARIPDWVVQVHASQYRNPGVLPAGAVLVVGSAQSGCQIVEDLLTAGRRVYLATSRVGRRPRRYRGRDTLAWGAVMGGMETTPAQVPDPAELHAAQPQISGVGPRGHTVSLQSLAHDGATLLGHLERVDGTTLHFSDEVADFIRFADATSTQSKHGIDEYIEHEHLDVPRASQDPPDPADAPCPDPDALAGPRALDLDAASVGAIIWCTGFGADFRWLHLPVLDAHGMPIHQDGMSRVAGLAFVGFPWLRRRASGIVYGVDDDARVIVDQLLAVRQ